MGFLKKDFSFPLEFVSNSKEETQQFAFEFAKTIKPFEFIAFFGGLGAGKTAFVAGFCEHFGVSEKVCSPSFSIVNEYFYENNKRIIHCDMYRISTEEDLCNILYFDFLKDLDSIMLVEWSENILEFLPKEYFSIKIEILDEEKRKIIIKREKGTE